MLYHTIIYIAHYGTIIKVETQNYLIKPVYNMQDKWKGMCYNVYLSLTIHARVSYSHIPVCLFVSQYVALCV